MKTDKHVLPEHVMDTWNNIDNMLDNLSLIKEREPKMTRHNSFSQITLGNIFL